MLSHATKEMGYGWGFGVHEAMDQAGALVGPLVWRSSCQGKGTTSLPFWCSLLPPG
jgi:hypothetical protein